MEENIFKLLNNLDGTAGIIIHDRYSNERISVNENEIFPAASIIKLYILWVLDKYVRSGKVNYDQRITLTDEVKVGGFGILKVMNNQLAPTLKDLAYLMICLSDNTATNILIDYIGIEKINMEIKANGFEQTILGRKMMDTEAKKRGFDNFTSPGDTLKVLTSLTAQEDTRNILKNQMCNNKLPLYFFRKVDFAHKTGDLPGIEHDAGTIYFENREVDIVVFTKNLQDNKSGVMLNNNIGEIVFNKYITEL